MVDFSFSSSSLNLAASEFGGGLRCRFRVSCLGPCLFVVNLLASFTATSISSLHRRRRYSVSVGERLALFIAS